MNWFNLALVGWVLVTAALGIAAWLLGVPGPWIAVVVIALVGIGVIVSAKSHGRDTPDRRP